MHEQLEQFAYFKKKRKKKISKNKKIVLEATKKQQKKQTKKGKKLDFSNPKVIKGKISGKDIKRTKNMNCNKFYANVDKILS